MFLVGTVTSGGKAADVVRLASEKRIAPQLIRQTAEGLEDGAAILRQALRTLDPRIDDPDDEDG